MYKCSLCKLRGCSNRDESKLMKICPTKEKDIQEEAKNLYLDDENKMIAYNAAIVESEGYGVNTRLKEIIEFAKKCNYKKIGVAFCIGLRREMEIVQNILDYHDFDVVSIICKNGAIPKSTIGIDNCNNITNSNDEVMCNPIGQALFLNEEKVDFNIIFGLCVGHDTLVMKYLEAPMTTLAVKDRATGHNPMAAIYNSESYFKKKLY